MIKISVVTAVFNSKVTVEQTINSILSQSYPAVESIVIDGLSTDGSLSILQSYHSRFGALISEPDHGIYDALNKGIALSTGDVVGFLHSDDIFDNNDVLAKIAVIFEDLGVQAVYGDLVYVHRENVMKVIRYWRAGEYNASSLSRGWMPPHPTFYVRRSVYERLGGFNTSYRISADYENILRLLAAGRIKIKYIPEVLVRMRVGGASNKSFKNIIQKSCEDLSAIQSNRVGGVATLLQKNLRKLSQFWKR